MKKDPVSKNEIPLGATAKEVRDDIPVNLSENEFVIPANVVRFFGVKHFESMIEKANKGYENMAAEGRLPEEEPLTDEEQAILAEVTGMAEGGLVQGQTPEEPKVVEPFDPSKWSYFNEAPTTSTSGVGVESRYYVNSQLETRAILFMNGKPVNPIPEGFVPDTAENRQKLAEDSGSTEAVEEPTTPEPDSPFDDGPESNAESKDYTAMSSADLLGDATDGLKAGNLAEKGIGFFAGSILGGPLGGSLANRTGVGEFLGMGVTSAVANAQIAAARGDEDTANSIYGAVVENSKYDSIDDIKANENLMSRAAKMAAKRTEETITATTPAASASSPSTASSEEGDDDENENTGRTSSGFGTDDPSSASWGMNKGGLVQSRKPMFKTKRKTLMTKPTK